MMKPTPGSALLLLIAAGLFAAPVAAQSAQDPPVAEQDPADAEAPPTPEPDRRDAEPAPRRTEPAERTVRTAPPPADVPASSEAPPSVIIQQVPVPVPGPPPTTTFDPYATANTVEILPDPYNEAGNDLEVLPEVTTRVDEGGGMGWPLIVAAILLLLGALAFLIARGGRRRPETVIHREVIEEAPPLAVLPPPPPAPVGRPRIDLRMRPVRAGVQGEGARVEFELTVLNEGPVDAEDVRVYTWMTQSGGGQDATRALLPPPGHVGTPPVSLAAGEARTLQASVALPRAELTGTSLLPAVVADIRYRLPGGREGRTAAAFSVGLPAGDELGAFPLDGAAGLHAGVIALPLGQPVKT
jgi:hypothetical protein